MGPVNMSEGDPLVGVRTNYPPGRLEVVTDTKANVQRVFEAITRLVMPGQRLGAPAAEMVPVSLQVAKLVGNVSKDDVNADRVGGFALEEVGIIKGKIPLGIEGTAESLKNG